MPATPRARNNPANAKSVDAVSSGIIDYEGVPLKQRNIEVNIDRVAFLVIIFFYRDKNNHEKYYSLIRKYFAF